MRWIIEELHHLKIYLTCSEKFHALSEEIEQECTMIKVLQTGTWFPVGGGREWGN